MFKVPHTNKRKTYGRSFQSLLYEMITIQCYKQKHTKNPSRLCYIRCFPCSATRETHAENGPGYMHLCTQYHEQQVIITYVTDNIVNYTVFHTQPNRNGTQLGWCTLPDKNHHPLIGPMWPRQLYVLTSP